MKKALMGTCVALLGLSASLPASAGVLNFTGPFDPANWTTTITGTVDGGGAANGNVDTTGAPASITINGGDDPAFNGCPGGVSGVAGACEISFTILHAPITYAFTWSYTTNDITPQYDQFGVIVDGVMTELIDNGGPLMQSGSFIVGAQSTFGWYINCTDCVGGNASATISQFGVPEPATLALFGLGLAGLGFMRRRIVE